MIIKLTNEQNNQAKAISGHIESNGGYLWCPPSPSGLIYRAMAYLDAVD